MKDLFGEKKVAEALENLCEAVREFFGEPLDSDMVDEVAEYIRLTLDHYNGNMTDEEFEDASDDLTGTSD